MKALTLWQPYATLVIRGLKRVETRPWSTAHRGPLAIHAARRIPASVRAHWRCEWARSALRAAGLEDWEDLPRGAVVGLVEVLDCVRVEDLGGLGELERALGDFRPGMWGWLLAGARELSAPFPARGRLGLFEVHLPSHPSEDHP
jgi:hypothetical protein